MKHEDFLFLIRKHRIYLILVFLIAMAGGAYVLRPKVLKYEGTAIFYLANESMVNPSIFGNPGQEDLLQVNLAQERIIQLAYSNQMMEHLIEQFDLYTHYGIDTTNKYYHQLAVSKLIRIIQIKKISVDISSITVIDRNNEVASAMANSIVWKLDQLNKAYLINKLQNNLTFYNSFLVESEQTVAMQNRNLDNYIRRLGDLRDNDKLSTKSINLEFSIYEAISQIQNITIQLLKAKNLYSTTLNSAQSKNLPSLVIIRSAMPDFNSKRIYLVGYGFLAGGFCVTIYLLLLYFFNSYSNDLRILFSRKY
ncbi:MAG: hypothetical protein IPG39_22575 [Bacteroidetes bacterium]|nr:hypothetical protein [Bacteroidota bacterium]MBK7971525.1 hypothetical protein [Bacteroidota bacterium]MBK8414747.1 hypothetical protein [Bacteroidota bacterium]MBK9047239.1 hypothetical protein [Bacteroidota bacterium]MBK9422903.1 hypothetical protein [Bacteroidota bacterium]